MKVCMIGPSRKVKGGISSVVNQYYDANIDELVHLKYIPTMEDGSKLYKIVIAFISYIRFIFIMPRYEILHVHMSSRASFWRKRYFIRYASFLKKKIIIHMHGSEFKVFYENECNKKKQKKICDTINLASIVLVLSSQWKDWFSKIVFPNKIIVLHNSILVPNNYEFQENNHSILFLGRLGKRKGIYDLLQATAILKKKIPNIHLYYGGDGEIDQVQKKCDELDLQNHSTYIGWVSGKDKEEFLKKCTVFALPSYNEGMPMSLLEGMSYGLIPVTTPVGGIPSIIINGENGFISSPGEIDDLVRNLEMALISECRSKVSINSYNTVLEKYNLKNNLKTLIEIYKDLLK